MILTSDVQEIGTTVCVTILYMENFIYTAISKKVALVIHDA